MSTADTIPVHPAWLPDAAFAPLGSRRVRVALGPDAADPVAATVLDEVRRATAAHGGALVTDDGPSDVVLRWEPDAPAAGFTTTRTGGVTSVVARDAVGLLHGLHALVRAGEAAFGADHPTVVDTPVAPVRMLDHWDNIDVHPVMGQVERGYAGGSIFYADGRVRDDLSRVAAYARLLGSIGINAVAINNVNVHRTEARLLTDGLSDVARVADLFRPHGVRTYLSVSFASPVVLGGLPTSDPADPDVQAWWAAAADRVYATIPDFGGFVVKADSEGQPGPFAYGRDHADGANLLARAVAPHGGTVFWRAFVYNHEQDWRDRRTDRARAAYDHFAPLDGRFDDNVVLQVKYGPMDFQTREPVSPVLAAMPRTRLAVELQVTQEYTGQQQHVCYLGPLWSQVLTFPLADGATRDVASIVAGVPGPGADAPPSGSTPTGGITAVSNVGDDEFWTGHPLAQANLYAYGRLAWDPQADPVALLDEWIGLTFPGADRRVRDTLHTLMDGSWLTYEAYTAPLGVGFMVDPGRQHYGPNVDGYEYSKWGTYHFADRDGVGVDRTVATGTGYTGQYPSPWRETYEDLATCPDELLLFFHHVPYGHVLHSGRTVIQHVYDSRADAVDVVTAWVDAWSALRGLVDDRLHARVAERLAEQVRSATEWRDQVRTYFFRKSGVPDTTGRPIH
ncbi:Alpha-glucuronidase [Cellulomonas flavigena DSM 20109]|uniref:Alpha-glucuronidase n=1 Tax=Cellulomonas flavigena (strain ATCC 482 / DSM 20109 / BCRC 11376 / JCM 18109 / NBRC 3775 / NCIMB 8073 / NRS 134) TaxID=446466 RepID=D5UKY5_CELFN|nr:alpha-glucuronidase [Cellulomonas flavigena]ADG75867.1 Alpha-glucuronidase [Cellulomonas flavigena DSM 20109]